LRYSYASLTTPFDTTFLKFPFTNAQIKGGAVTGNLGLVYRPNDNWQLTTNFSTGYRIPNIDDVGKVFGSEPGNVIVPNTQLQSEYAYNIDLGIVTYINNRFRLDVTAFYTYLDNAIVRRPFNFNGRDSIFYEGINSKVQALQNVAQASVWGIQTGYEWAFTKNLSWFLRANLIYGKETDDTKDEEVIIQQQINHSTILYNKTNRAGNRSWPFP